MNLLVLGGSKFLGRAIVEHAVSAGLDVTCLTRGTGGSVPRGAGWVQGDRDRDDWLAPVQRVTWDAVIDVAREPGHVRRACRDLAGDPHYVFVSTGSVYSDDETRGQDESAPVVAPLEADEMPDMGAYGAAKVACERHVLSRFDGGGCCIARAGLIGGPGDTSGRSGYWPWRFAHPSTADGAVLVPDVPAQPMQMVDVRDLAAWLVHCAKTRVAGIFDAVGPRSTLGTFLQAASDIGANGRALPAPASWLVGHGVQEWMGDDSLPLWIADTQEWGFGDRVGQAAVDAGLRHRPIEECFADTLAWELEQPHPHGAGLRDDLERTLIASWRDEHAH